MSVLCSTYFLLSYHSEVRLLIYLFTFSSTSIVRRIFFSRSSWQGRINALKSLELCYSGVRDSHLSRLKFLPMLEELNLDSCPIGDWAIVHLADNNVVPNLTSLDLADTDITDIGMSKIAQFKHIKRLSLFYCVSVNNMFNVVTL